MKKQFFCTLLLTAAILVSMPAATAAAGQETDNSALIGTWDVELIDVGFAMELVFKMEEDTLTGEMIFEMGSGVMENIEFKDNELTFYVEFDAGGQIVGVDVSGTVEEDKISGFMNSDMGSAEFTGTKREEG